ncbi:TonB-dependent receptor [Hymenobacter terrenus]|uniref:TonB-dependent receptor n=1 Tax=Hymenobacter terrenus TaxID=1629124 RepID=UPI0006193597|nr:TonB-dependent receptor [Hymenobacter terrenus]
MRLFLLGFFLLWINTLAFGQQGTLAGKVTDKKTKEGVIGATVLVTGTTQAAPVSLDGSYSLPLDAGTYNITVTYVGYKPLTFPGIVIKSGETTTLNGTMEESATSLTEVTVTGVKQTGTEVALIQDLKKSEVVVSGMSSDQIVKSLDRDAAEVVKRIPGVTIQSNNFIVIRGLAERYNTVMLNDVLTPSAEVDTRSFSFDILPSSVIDRVLIFKSGSPELPGEMGGGVVKVYTKNSVLENSTSLTVSGWYRHNTTFKDFLTSPKRGDGGLRTETIGYDGGDRQLPDNFPDRVERQPISFKNIWLPRSLTALPDLRISLGLARKYEIGSVYLSNVTSLSYSNTREQYTNLRQRFLREFDPETNRPALQWTYDDTQSNQAVRVGVVHNWQVRLNDRNRLEFRNFLNQYATDEVARRVGQTLDQGFERNDNALHYQSRTVYSGQLSGTHQTGKNDRSTINWASGYNYVFRDEPDYSRYRNQRRIPEPGLPTREFQVVIPPVGNSFDASRFFSDLRENTYMANGQFERSIPGRDTTKANTYKVRVGFYAEQKERTLQNRVFSYIVGRESTFNRALEILPIDQIFAPQNIDPVTGFVLQEGTTGEDRYTGRNTLMASYVGIVAPISDKFSISGGVRGEYNRRYLKSGNPLRAPYRENKFIPMPSVNATYNFNDRSLLRLASSVTANRPEFREIASYEYFDFINNAVVRGNDSLRTATIYNADLRYEFYPTRSEMISFGVFGKIFRNAIEQTTLSVATEQLNVTFQNADRAIDLGAEVEARKSLRDLTENVFLQRFSAVVNASLIYSTVRLTDNSRNRDFALNDRPLQGQSPYVVNAGLFYQDDESRLQVSAQYNVVGQRIRFVGDQRNNYSIIEMPRHVVDLAVTKSFGKHLQMRVGIQDLLNQRYRFLYDYDGNSKISGNEDGSFASYRRGSYSTFGLTWNF